MTVKNRLEEDFLVSSLLLPRHDLCFAYYVQWMSNIDFLTSHFLSLSKSIWSITSPVSILQNKNLFCMYQTTYHFLGYFLNPFGFTDFVSKLSNTQRRQWDLFSNFQLLWWMLLVWDHMFVYVASAMTLKIVEDCFLSRIDLHHVKSSVVAQSIISSEDSWVDPSTNATQLTEKYKQQLGADKFILSYSFTKWWWSKINKEAFGQEKK